MIELNLLPDVKLEYIKAQRARRLVISVSFLISAISIGLLVLLFTFGLLQKKHMSDVTNDIVRNNNTLKAKRDINKILTVQSQLDSLTKLHEAKPDASRLLGYLNQLTPAELSLESLHLDFAASTMTLTGSANSLSSVNKYVDTLKLTNYSTEGTQGSTKAFSGVILQSFALSSGATANKAATFSVNLTFDPNIFNITQKTKLAVPTTSNRAQADSLFSTSGLTGGSN